MCGRITMTATGDALVEAFQLSAAPDLQARYNLAPSQDIPVVRLASACDERRVELMRWGLVPRWAKDPSVGYRMINARAETIASRPAYRDSFRARRCLVLADGFYEWRTVGNAKQPFYLHLLGRRPFALAGLWDQWSGPSTAIIESCTIVTTEPNDLVRPIHDRMPVILPAHSYREWLDPKHRNIEKLLSLLEPYPSEKMAAFEVGFAVNDPDRDDPECIVKVLPRQKSLF